MYIKSYSQLKEKKELKKQQLDFLKVRLFADYYQLVYSAEKVKDGFNWWKRIMFGIQLYKQAREVFRRFRS